MDIQVQGLSNLSSETAAFRLDSNTPYLSPGSVKCYDKAGTKWPIVVVQGEYNGRPFTIAINSHGRPVAYVKLIEEKDTYTLDQYNTYEHEGAFYGGELDTVHGGSTFSGKRPWDEDGIWIGWDYGHGDDYDPVLPQLKGKKWTMIEILMDIARADAELECIERMAEERTEVSELINNLKEWCR